VSEMAYIFGCLITGGEIRRAKLMPDEAGGKAAANETGTEAAPKLKILGPIIASLIAIVACGAAVWVSYRVWGKDVIKTFQAGSWSAIELPQKFPPTWDAFWDQMDGQLKMLRKMFETWGDLHWTRWQVPLFVYLVTCLSIRLAPVGRPIRSVLVAVIVIAAGIFITGAINDKFKDVLTDDVWPLLTYVWATLLMLLVATLVLHGIVALVRGLAGGGGKAKGAKTQ
jgi:hypothetical protein